jgi:hypothetical protein
MNTLDSFADPHPDRWWHVVHPSLASDIKPLLEVDRFVRWFGSGMAD